MESICRLCLKESSGIVEELREGCDILDKLSIFLSYHVSLSESLPNKICYPCINKVKEIYAFYQTIKQNEIILQQKLQNILCGTVKKEVKKESTHYCDENEPELINSYMKDKSVAEVDGKPEYKNSFMIDLQPIGQSNLNIKISKERTRTLKQSNNSFLDDLPLNVLTENNHLRHVGTKYEDQKRHRCLTCFEVFSNQLELLRHYQTIELVKFNKSNNQSDKQIELTQYTFQESEDGSLMYKCERCYKIYRSKIFIERHILSHIETRPFLCKLCGKTYKTASIIVAHGKMHTGEMYLCSYNCGYRSVHKHVVKDHEKRHRKEYKYKCDTCGKGFQVKTWYEQHQNIHKGIKPFSCDLCGMTFHLHKYLTTHQSNVHPQSSARKPWICKLCLLPCDSKNSLNIHLKENHGVLVKKHILCDICGKVVRDTQQLNQHKRAVHLHIKPYVCGVCNKSFPKKFTLSVHEQSHTGKRYLCNNCDKMFSRKSSLQRHVTRFHIDLKHKCKKCEKTFTSLAKLATHEKNCKKDVEN